MITRGNKFEVGEGEERRKGFFEFVLYDDSYPHSTLSNLGKSKRNKKAEISAISFGTFRALNDKQ